MPLMEQWLSVLPALPALPVLSALPIPLWLAGVVALLLLTLLIAVIWLIGLRRIIRFTFTYGLFIALLGGGYYAFREYEDINQRKLLEERANALFAQTIQPGTVFACLDGSPVPAMQDACERTLFAEPQRVATAVAITTQRVAYLVDAVRFASTRDHGYFSRVQPLRKTIESDPYGFAGFVLTSVYHCMADLCDKFSILDNPERVKENIRSRRYEAYMAKYAGVWRGEPLQEDRKRGSDTILPGVAVGDKPSNIVPLDAGPPALFDPVPRGNPMPSGPMLGPQTTAPTAATAPAINPPPTVGGQPRTRSAPGTDRLPPVAAPPRSQVPTTENTSPFTPVSAPATRPVLVEPDEKTKGEKKAAAPKAEEPKASAQKKSTKGEAKGEVYRPRGNEPVAGLPRLVPGDYKRHDPNEIPDTPTPSGVLMPN